MEAIMNLSNRLISNVDLNFQRTLFERIDWSQRLIEIRGSRGIGKTTLLLQKSNEIQAAGGKVVYASLDTPYFYTTSLFEFADELTKYGGTHLFLDEVHRYPSKSKSSDWSLEIKNIYDAFPELQIVYSGSSILHLYKGKGDLSRRKASYLLNGLSFREYLKFNDIIDYQKLSLAEIIVHHEEIAKEIVQKIRPLLHFKTYLNVGFYPFYNGNEEVFFQQLQDMVNQIIDTDLPYLATITQGAQEQLKRLLGAISSTVPYVPNMKTLAELIHVTDHRTLLKYLHLLEQAQLISLLSSNAKGNKLLEKPDKIFLNNTNLKHALSMRQSDLGSDREAFFFNQLNQSEQVSYPKKGDFYINNKYLFEIGGKNKSKTQIAKEDNAYIVADGIEIGFGNKIPLWLFGFL
jgi:predicted AAA+ superfamily ATPase